MIKIYFSIQKNYWIYSLIFQIQIAFVIGYHLQKIKTKLKILIYQNGFPNLNIYTNKIYESHSKSKLEELYDEINLVNQLSNEVQFIEKIFSENIIREQANKLNYNNNEFITNLFNELKNSIEFGDDEKEKIIIIIKRLSFLDLHEVANGLEPICESYRQYILNFIKDKIFEELLKEEKPSKKGKKHKKNKKAKIEIKDGLKENEEENKDN